nr:STAS domain-containing protein [Mycolicibacterium komanii]CRL68583.1 anti-sigma-factor antagonist [Mycolicibacterium komanii]
MQSVEVSRTIRGSTVVLTVSGVVDSDNYCELRNQIVQTALEEPHAVLIDVTGMDAPAGSAWTVFSSAWWHVDRWPGVPLFLVCADPSTRAVINRTGVTRNVPLFADLDAALEEAETDRRLQTRRRARAELPAAVASLQRSRELTTQWLTAWSRTEMISTANVVATTLVENVLRHTDSHPELRIECDGATIAIAVTDESHDPAMLREAATATASPSGLFIVAALSRGWGNAVTSSGKTVWALLGPENALP